MTKGPIDKEINRDSDDPAKNPKRDNVEGDKRSQDDDVEYIPPRRPHEYINPKADEDDEMEIENKDDIEGLWNPEEEEKNNDEESPIDEDLKNKINRDTALDTNDSEENHHETDNLKK
jgi:hypothetical protein